MTKPSCEDTFLVKHRDLKNSYYSFTFGPYPLAGKCKPGSFVHVQMPNSGIYFRRAMSVAGVNPDKQEIEIIFKVFGRGTTVLAEYRKDDRINLLGPLGNDFTLPSKHETTVIVAGGVGFPPLMYMATDMVKRGYDPKTIEFFYGGRSAADIVERSRIKKLGVRFHPVTEDGSLGDKGFVTDSVEKYLEKHAEKKLRIYGCGPEAMLKVTDDLGMRYNVPGQVSLEAPMPCGIGVCLGCIVPLRKGGNARVCVDGPVFNIGEVIL